MNAFSHHLGLARVECSNLPLPVAPCQVSRTGWHWTSAVGVLMVAAETAEAAARTAARRIEVLNMVTEDMLRDGEDDGDEEDRMKGRLELYCTCDFPEPGQLGSRGRRPTMRGPLRSRKSAALHGFCGYGTCCQGRSPAKVRVLHVFRSFITVIDAAHPPTLLVWAMQKSKLA